MKHLLIARHAKSSWDDFTIDDHERPILEKGRRKSIRVAAELKSRGIIPDMIISSTAVRAKETALLLARELEIPEDKVVFNKHLYHAYDDEVLAELFALDDSVNTVMIVGHNPTLTDVVNHFSNKPIDNLPTSAVASVTFKTDSWEETGNCKFKFNFIVKA